MADPSKLQQEMQSVYILIAENGEKRTTKELSEKEKLAIDDCTLDVIDITDCNNPKEFCCGEWYDLKKHINSSSRFTENG